MSQAASRGVYAPRFFAAHPPASVREAVKSVVRDREDIIEAHLVAMGGSPSALTRPALVMVSAEAPPIAVLERQLSERLQSHVRPKIIVLSPEHPDLPLIRGLDGELKREIGRRPWWLLLFLGI